MSNFKLFIIYHKKISFIKGEKKVEEDTKESEQINNFLKIKKSDKNVCSIYYSGLNESLKENYKKFDFIKYCEREYFKILLNLYVF